MKSKKTRTGYMCKVDFEWEVGEALGGNTIYASIKDLKANRKCWSQCGIVKVNVVLDKVIVKENYPSAAKIAIAIKELQNGKKK